MTTTNQEWRAVERTTSPSIFCGIIPSFLRSRKRLKCPQSVYPRGKTKFWNTFQRKDEETTDNGQPVNPRQKFNSQPIGLKGQRLCEGRRLCDTDGVRWNVRKIFSRDEVMEFSYQQWVWVHFWLVLCYTSLSRDWSLNPTNDGVLRSATTSRNESAADRLVRALRPDVLDLVSLPEQPGPTEATYLRVGRQGLLERCVRSQGGVLRGRESTHWRWSHVYLLRTNCESG